MLHIVEKALYTLSLPSTRSETRFDAREGATCTTASSSKSYILRSTQRSSSANTHAWNSNLNGRKARYAERSVDSASPGRARGAECRATARQNEDVIKFIILPPYIILRTTSTTRVQKTRQCPDSSRPCAAAHARTTRLDTTTHCVTYVIARA